MDAVPEPPIKTLWPLWISIGFPLLLITLDSTPIGVNFAFVMVGIPVLLCIWAGLGVQALIIAVLHVRSREWSRAAISAVLPLVITLAGVWHWQFLRLCNDAGDVGFFIAARSFYLERMRTTAPDGQPRLSVFNRGGMLWASRGYVYDESDEILRNEASRSASWRTRAEGTELTCGFYAQAFPIHFPFAQHWYLASFDC